VTKSQTRPHHGRNTRPAKRRDEKLPFSEHVAELRRRLFYIAVSVVAFGTAGYFVQQQLVHFLLRPAHGQQFIYTTPGGGLNFLFQVCLYFGLALSIPVIIHQVLRYIEPLIETNTKRVVAWYSLVSGMLAVAGAALGYWVGLPVALRFLSHQFTTPQIRPLLTIQEYMSFVMIYLIGSALLFQIPALILFINRIRPLRPRQLLSGERYVVAGAFIVAAIMTPTTDILDQLIFVVPIVVMYQIALAGVYLQDRRRRRSADQTVVDVRVARDSGGRRVVPDSSAPARQSPGAFGAGVFSIGSAGRMQSASRAAAIGVAGPRLNQSSYAVWDIVAPDYKRLGRKGLT
jgi:sec-independent protein translocase protein TatC